MNRWLAPLFIALQYLLPRMSLTAAVHRLARVRATAVKNALIRGFVRLYRVDTAEVDGTVPRDFACFNDFFIRELRAGARDIDASKTSIVSPVDGIVSAAGALDEHRLLQAKGRYYSLYDLLATDLAEAAAFVGGTFATLYLAPWHYHRVHAPWAGRLMAARYVPGDLFSVNDATATRIPNLFVRNERLVCHFLTDDGPAALIFVGALNVGSIGTPWSGDIRPRKRGVVEELDLHRAGHDPNVVKGDLLGWFNMGSTVILLMPPGIYDLQPDLTNGKAVVMGKPIATQRSLSS